MTTKFVPTKIDARGTTRGGFTNMGSVSVPPMPLPLLLTDRDTGKVWNVSFSMSGPDAVGRMSINDDLRVAIRDGSQVYPVGSEPVVFYDQTGYYRLFVRDARIGIDYTPFGSGETAYAYTPVFARIFADNVNVRQVYGKTTDKARLSMIYNEATR